MEHFQQADDFDLITNPLSNQRCGFDLDYLSQIFCGNKQKRNKEGSLFCDRTSVNILILDL